MTIYGLPIVCVYSTHCTKYILFPIKIAINGHYILDFVSTNGIEGRKCPTSPKVLRTINATQER